MKIRFIRDRRGIAAGTVVDWFDGVAAEMVRRHFAVPVGGPAVEAAVAAVPRVEFAAERVATPALSRRRK
jgi:hypothetical protein